MLILLLTLLFGALIIEGIRKYVLRIKDPDIEDLWNELNEREWYRELLENPQIKKWIEIDKESGLLSDPYYVRKILDKEDHRQGFIKYIRGKINI
ncbi:hypothetical protein SM124_05825 [Bacillus sp. 31A1R]|uniref:Uncharacterized protein n=1 Tax=Robertmurraya mangrovi TaxID=3098077 RepID=A0ABU5IVU0_9BACI|nr:hypothetical protein [Bacillus sp. 31A1R]MDZ5471260.1 hypothetical protein [Bacillus sp. 31A1R]